MRASEMENKIYKQRFLSTKKKVYDKKEKEKSNFLGLIHMDGVCRCFAIALQLIWVVIEWANEKEREGERVVIRYI